MESSRFRPQNTDQTTKVNPSQICLVVRWSIEVIPNKLTIANATSCSIRLRNHWPSESITPKPHIKNIEFTFYYRSEAAYGIPPTKYLLPYTLIIIVYATDNICCVQTDDDRGCVDFRVERDKCEQSFRFFDTCRRLCIIILEEPTQVSITIFVSDNKTTVHSYGPIQFTNIYNGFICNMISNDEIQVYIISYIIVTPFKFQQ